MTGSRLQTSVGASPLFGKRSTAGLAVVALLLSSPLSSQAAPAESQAAPNLDLRSLSPPPLPPDTSLEHSNLRSMSIGPMQGGRLIEIGGLRPIKLEASFNEPLTLRDALTYTLDHNLPIKVAAETYNMQLHLYRSALSGFLPNFSMIYGLTHTHIFTDTEANTRLLTATVSYPVFQGGRVLYGSLSQFYRSRGWSYSYRGTINDTLLNVYKAYMNLLLNRALLQIRIKSLETSEAQLRLNEQLYTAGTGTRFAVMQSRTQLALDRQSLLLQQVAVRQSVLALAYSMNVPLAINLIPVEETVGEAALIDENLKINQLLDACLKHRPELRQVEMFRLAAARNIQVQTAALYPTASLFLRYNNTSTTVNGGTSRGAGSSLSGTGGPTPFSSGFGGFNGLIGANITQFASPPATVTPITPATATSNATNPTSGSSGTNTPTGPSGSPSATIPSGGTVDSSSISNPGNSAVSNPFGNAPSNSSTSGSVSATNAAIAAAAGGGTNSVLGSGQTSSVSIVGGQTIGAAISGVSPTGLGVPGSLGASLPPAIATGGVFAGHFRTVAWGMQLTYNFSSLDYPVYANIQAARALARQALVQANQQLIGVNQQVRASYLNALAARRQIDVTAAGVASAAEALRLANLRVQTGVGTNLELIQAQRDYITALVNQAQAIINSNVAQAQLLHDTGLISVETLTTGYAPTTGSLPNRSM